MLPAGTMTLTIAGAGENNAATGDLDIHGSVTIKGKGAGVTIVDGNNLDRVFDIFSGHGVDQRDDDSAWPRACRRRRATE